MISKKIVSFSVNRPKLVVILSLAIILAFGIQIRKIRVDTDPENMLSPTEPVRVSHNQTKKEFTLHDFIVLGIVNNQDPDGVFNPKTLEHIYSITRQIKKIPGVISYDLISPSTMDTIIQAGPGSVRFDWLMKYPPKDRQGAIDIRQMALDNPMLKGTLVSEDGKAICLYIPIEQKDISYKVSQQIRQITKKYSGQEKFYITGLPIAEDTFGVEMFRQMAISAPLAALIIFFILWFFFKKISLIISAMLVAGMSVAAAMGLLIGLGYPVHIMSSMIPIFLMPIAVVDSVHILSEFFDRYPQYHDQRKTIIEVMDHLFKPMLYTSLTSSVGFASMAFTPIPPVKIFGVMVAFGIMVAWILTITFIPAYTMLIPANWLRQYGVSKEQKGPGKNISWLDSFISWQGHVTWKHEKIILSITGLIIIVSIVGITRLNINDNPVRWFTRSHPIRIADEVLNKHFGGTYEAYLVLEAKEEDQEGQGELFKQPSVLRYIEQLQKALVESPLVGKSTSVADVVKKIHYELRGGDKTYNRVPESVPAVAQILMTYQNSHDPDDLWHLVTPDYQKANIWVQLKSGDNQDMEQVVQLVDRFFLQNPPPSPLQFHWAGLTYLNIVWQQKMVYGMLRSLLGSFFIVLIMMIILFRSSLWGLFSMIPLSVTIVFIYGLIGFIGKDYDMPVAILSALTLGLSVDFAIHYLQRTQSMFTELGNWSQIQKKMFQEPARAIYRNAIVIGIGFLPLLAAPLVPYKTVGFFMGLIMLTSSLVTMMVLPSLMNYLQGALFAVCKIKGYTCDLCIAMNVIVIVITGYFIYKHDYLNWSGIGWISALFVILTIIMCNFVARRRG